MIQKEFDKNKISDEVSEKLLSAMNDVVKLFTDTMNDKNAKIELRINCAKEIMERIYGKSTLPLEKEFGDKPFEVEITVVKD